MALSRKERGPGVAGRCCARERVVLCARVRIGQETGSMRCIPDVVLERFSVNHGRRSWRVSQLADRQNSLSPHSMQCVSLAEPRLLGRGEGLGNCPEEVRQGQVNYVIRITCAIKMYSNRFHHCTPRLLSKR